MYIQNYIIKFCFLYIGLLVPIRIVENIHKRSLTSK